MWGHFLRDRVFGSPKIPRVQFFLYSPFPRGNFGWKKNTGVVGAHPGPFSTVFWTVCTGAMAQGLWGAFTKVVTTGDIDKRRINLPGIHRIQEKGHHRSLPTLALVHTTTPGLHILLARTAERNTLLRRIHTLKDWIESLAVRKDLLTTWWDKRKTGASLVWCCF